MQILHEGRKKFRSAVEYKILKQYLGKVQLLYETTAVVQKFGSFEKKGCSVLV